MTKSAIGWLLAVCVGLPACGDDDAQEGTASLEISGEWESNFMSTEVIADGSWSVDSSFGTSISEIVEFSNDDNAAVLLGDDGTYGRNVWTEIEDDSFYYCVVAFGQATPETAVAESEPYDASDPLNGGCGSGDFGWTMLTRR
jgi:hypothetical protein